MSTTAHDDAPTEGRASGAALIKGKLRQGLAQLPYLPRALGLIWQASPGWTASWLLLRVGQGALPVATVYLTRAVVDGSVSALEGGRSFEEFRPLLWLLMGAGLVLVLQLLLGALGRWVRAVQAERVDAFLTGLIQGKSAALDLAFYDRPEFYDHLHRARTDARHRPVALLDGLGTALQDSVTLAAMAAVLLPYGLWLPVALLLSTVPALWLVVRHRLALHRMWLRTTRTKRRAEYYDCALSTRQSAHELRLLNLGPWLQARYGEVRARLADENLRLVRTQGLDDFLAGLVGLSVTMGATAWILWRVIQGHATLGDLALFYQAFSGGQRLAHGLLATAGDLYLSSLFIADLFAFLELRPAVVDAAAPRPAPARLERGVTFEDVTFAYPGNATPALQSFSMSIPADKITAVVGENGAGKSTLFKLLCRLYDPSAGRVLLDGTDLRELRLADLRRMITVLFQEPFHWWETAGQNVGLGDLSLAPDKARVERAAAAAGADALVRRLPRGYDTSLGAWFEGGEDLSAGEWQRLALARAFYRDAPLMLLDEPTSALDSWAEADWMDRFRALAAGRTAVVITHRFSTARHADLIHVVRSGRVVESGSHGELVARGGSYAEAWRRLAGEGGGAAS